MTIEKVNKVHEYMIEHDLLNLVESRTKKKWDGHGSRATYYSGLANKRAGKRVGPMEALMLLEAEALMDEHSKEALLEEESA